MGRGKGKSPRDLLLAGKRKSSGPEEILFEYQDEDRVGHRFIDTEGRRVVRSYSDRDKEVETSEYDFYKEIVYAYKSELDNDLLGDAVVVRKVIEEDSQIRYTLFYSDEETLLRRSKDNRSIPVSAVREKGELIEEEFNWIDEGVSYSSRREYNDLGDKVLLFKEGELHDIDGQAAHLKYQADSLKECEEFYTNGSPASVDGHPSVIQYNEDGGIWQETWLDENGDRHRIGAPAYICYDESKRITEVQYWIRGDNLHENPGSPALVTYWDNGQTKEEVYTRKEIVNTNGENQEIISAVRPDGLPGKISYFYNGQVNAEHWFEYSEPGKINLNHYLYSRGGDLPAVIVYYESGNKQRVEYRKDGVFHSTEGPARLMYDDNGTGLAVNKKYYIKGEELTKGEWERRAGRTPTGAP